ncbi:dienelactone hydrolase family protein, partial [Dactylosporangium maewongense]|uniref:dienelactone hydrolase family protein n=1 Tax=Dactylosporangium maewongense TaxID=634393 RepID=UPI0031CDDBFA
DPVVPDEAVAAFQDELRTRPDLDWQVITYSGAEHGFTLPGGAYHPAADARSWRELTALRPVRSSAGSRRRGRSGADGAVRIGRQVRS